MRTRIKAQYQIWNAPTKEEKFSKVWESIKTEIKAMQQKETLRNEKTEINSREILLF